MRLYIYIFILLLLCIFPLGAQQERSESYIRISPPVSLAGALDEIESQTNYSFIYDAQVINLSEKVRKSLSGRTVFEILNLLFKNTEIVYTVMNDQIILNKKEAIIQMQQKLDGKVKGIVTDHKGEPIACVNVVEKGTRNGTITDMDGSFVLELPEEATLVFSYIGYRSREIEYEGQLSLNVQLEDDAQILDEVVITALGIEKKESSLPYATQLITGGELVRAKDFNFMSTLSGKMAGLQINRTSAGLGSSSRVIIRGSRSASGNNQPLYVIDGVPILSISSEPFFDDVGGQLAGARNLAEETPGGGEVAAVHGTEQFRTQHRHIFRIVGAEEEVAFVGAGAATHAGIHEDLEGTVLGKTFLQGLIDDFFPVFGQVPILFLRLPRVGMRHVQPFHDIHLGGIGVHAGLDLGLDVHPAFFGETRTGGDHFFRFWHFGH